jgi:hypothetical protein
MDTKTENRAILESASGPVGYSGNFSKGLATGKCLLGALPLMNR